MNAEPEDEFFDRELRNAFHGFSMPPAEHPEVWTGIQGRIAGLPAAGPSLPRRLVVPVATAVVGLAVGWLLPHPAPQPAPAPAPTELRLQPVHEEPVREETAPTPAPVAVREAPAAAPAAVAAAPAATRRAPAARPAAPEATTPAPEMLVSWPTTAPDLAANVPAIEQLAAPEPPKAAVASYPAATPKQPAAHQSAAAELAGKSARPEGSSERIVYHKPRSRQPESGTGFRRWFSHLGQSLRHLVGL